MAIYRAERSVEGDELKKRKHGTKRAPENVPYIVDNLWEWKRPEEYPNRRYSVFAAPSPESAAASATNASRLYTVSLPADARIVQIRGISDAKLHRDCKHLPRKLMALLYKEGWTEKSADEKRLLSPLWAPCLSKEEVESLFTLEPLASIRKEMWCSVSFWEDVGLLESVDNLADNVGEIFFEAGEWTLCPFELNDQHDEG